MLKVIWCGMFNDMVFMGCVYICQEIYETATCQKEPYKNTYCLAEIYLIFSQFLQILKNPTPRTESISVCSPFSTCLITITQVYSST